MACWDGSSFIYISPNMYNSAIYIYGSRRLDLCSTSTNFTYGKSWPVVFPNLVLGRPHFQFNFPSQMAHSSQLSSVWQKSDFSIFFPIITYDATPIVGCHICDVPPWKAQRDLIRFRSLAGGGRLGLVEIYGLRLCRRPLFLHTGFHHACYLGRCTKFSRNMEGGGRPSQCQSMPRHVY